MGDGNAMKGYEGYLLCTRNGGLDVLSTQSPLEPKLIANIAPLNPPMRNTDLVIGERQVYTIGPERILAYNITDLTQPVAPAVVASESGGMSGSIRGTKLYVIEWGGGDRSRERNGITVYSTVDPTKLRELMFIPIDDMALRVFPIDDNRLLVSCETALRPSQRYPSVLPRPLKWMLAAGGNSALIREFEHHHAQLGNTVLFAINDDGGSKVQCTIKAGGKSSNVANDGSSKYYLCGRNLYEVRDHTIIERGTYPTSTDRLEDAPHYGDSYEDLVGLCFNDEVLILKCWK